MNMISLFIAGIILGVGMAVAVVGPPEPPHDDSKLYAIINQYKNMIARDDMIIDHMNGAETWDMTKPIFARSYLISNGATVWTYTQKPSVNKYYELSF